MKIIAVRIGEKYGPEYGLSYQEIALKGGGILNSAKKLANTSFSELYDSAATRLEKVMKMGTGAIEINR